MKNNNDPEMQPEEIQEAVDFLQEMVDEPGSENLEGLPEVERLKFQLHEAEKKALRYQADFDNFRRRTRRESEDQLKYAAAPLLTDMLDAVDNLQRAVESVPDGESESPLAVGVKMVLDQLHAVLRLHGCKAIDAVGEKFNPSRHRSAGALPSQEVAPDHVLHVARTGYQLHDRVLRPAEVVLSSGPNA